MKVVLLFLSLNYIGCSVQHDHAMHQKRDDVSLSVKESELALEAINTEDKVTASTCNPSKKPTNQIAESSSTLLINPESDRSDHTPPLTITENSVFSEGLSSEVITGCPAHCYVDEQEWEIVKPFVKKLHLEYVNRTLNKHLAFHFIDKAAHVKVDFQHKNLLRNAFHSSVDTVHSSNLEFYNVTRRIPCSVDSPNNSVCLEISLNATEQRAILDKIEEKPFMPPLDQTSSEEPKATPEKLTVMKRSLCSKKAFIRISLPKGLAIDQPLKVTQLMKISSNGSSEIVRKDLAEIRLTEIVSGEIIIPFLKDAFSVNCMFPGGAVEKVDSNLHISQRTARRHQDDEQNTSQNSSVNLEISCPRCNFNLTQVNLKPVLQVTTDEINKIIKQSDGHRLCGSQPNRKEKCCRDKTHINIHELGWSKWILEPTEFDFYFCRGRCPKFIADWLPGDSRFTDFLNTKGIRSDLSYIAEHGITPCCHAKSKQPLRILLMDSRRHIFLKTLEDMIVTECECAPFI